MQFDELPHGIPAKRNYNKCASGGCIGYITKVQELQRPGERYSGDSFVVFFTKCCESPDRIRLSAFLKSGKIVRLLNKNLQETPIKKVPPPIGQVISIASRPRVTRQASAEMRLLGMFKKIYERGASKHTWCL